MYRRECMGGSRLRPAGPLLYSAGMNTSAADHASPSQPEAEWLSLIRYQLDVGLEQVRSPAPLNALAINTLQDSVEAMICLVGEHLNAPLKNKADFAQIFDAVAATMTDPSNLMGHCAAMVALNTARVNFKHHGNAPTDATIRRHAANAQSFIEQLCQEIFSTSLGSISLLLFIPQDDVRASLERSGNQWAAGERFDALVSLRLAFDSLIRNFIQRKSWYPGKSLFSTKPSFMPGRAAVQRLGSPFDKILEWLESLDDWVGNIAIGIDMRRYAFFTAHTPTVHYTMSGNHITQGKRDVQATDDDYERCYKFVIDTALSLNANDYTIKPWDSTQS